MRSILTLVSASLLSLTLFACGAAQPSEPAPKVAPRAADEVTCKPPTGNPPATCEEQCHYDAPTRTCQPGRGIKVPQ